MPSELDAIVLAAPPHSQVGLLGLTLAERGQRVAMRAGARRVFVVDSPAAALELVRWEEDRGEAALLVIRAADQVVHLPLVMPLLGGLGERRIAVGPDGSYAGALWVHGAVAHEVIAAISSSPEDGDVTLVRRWDAAETIPHGDIAVHRARTAMERAGAKKMLLRLNIKKEDNPITKYCYRPLSRPLTRLLLHTPVTPNQISIMVGLLGLLGCFITALPGQAALVWGAAIILFAGVLDGCDGEIARLRLISSPFGAWLDTVVDEITTTGYCVAIGYHTYVHHPAAWLGWSIVIAALAYVATIYSIYYFCVVVIKKGGSQFYIGTLDVVEGPDGVGLRERPRSPTIRSPLLRQIGAWLTYLKTRDAINLGAMFLTLVDAYELIYYAMLIGGLITAAVIVPEHLRLRAQLRHVARRGGIPRLV